MVLRYIYGDEETPDYETLKRRRAIAEAIAAQRPREGGHPITTGLTQLGEGFGSLIGQMRLRQAEAAFKQRQQTARQNLPQGGGDTAPPAAPRPQAAPGARPAPPPVTPAVPRPPTQVNPTVNPQTSQAVPSDADLGIRAREDEATFGPMDAAALEPSPSFADRYSAVYDPTSAPVPPDPTFAERFGASGDRPLTAMAGPPALTQPDVPPAAQATVDPRAPTPGPNWPPAPPAEPVTDVNAFAPATPIERAVAPAEPPIRAGEGGYTPAKFANVRYNNPGAMYPGPAAKQFGSIGSETIGGGHKIAHFPTPVHGAAANMANLERGYVGKTIGAAVDRWSGGGRNTIPGFDSKQVITPEMVRDPNFAVPFMKAIASGEAPGRYPMSDQQWRTAHQWYTQGAPGDDAGGGGATPYRNVAVQANPRAEIAEQIALNPQVMAEQGAPDLQGVQTAQAPDSEAGTRQMIAEVLANQQGPQGVQVASLGDPARSGITMPRAEPMGSLPLMQSRQQPVPPKPPPGTEITPDMFNPNPSFVGGVEGPGMDVPSMEGGAPEVTPEMLDPFAIPFNQPPAPGGDTNAGAAIPVAPTPAAAPVPPEQPAPVRVAQAQLQPGVMSDTSQGIKPFDPAQALPPRLVEAPFPPPPPTPQRLPDVAPNTVERKLIEAASTTEFGPDYQRQAAANLKLEEGKRARQQAQQDADYASQVARYNEWATAKRTHDLAAQTRQLELREKQIGVADKEDKAILSARLGGRDPEKFFADFDKEKKAADTQAHVLGQIQIAKQAIKDGVITGTAQGLRIDSAKLQEWMFNNKVAGTLASNTERMQAALNSMLSIGVQNMQGTDSKVTEGDIAIARGTVAADPKLQRETITSVMGEMERIAREKLNEYEDKRDYYLGGTRLERQYEVPYRSNVPAPITQRLLENRNKQEYRDEYDKHFGRGAAQLEIDRAKRRERRGG